MGNANTLLATSVNRDPAKTADAFSRRLRRWLGDVSPIVEIEIWIEGFALEMLLRARSKELNDVTSARDLARLSRAVAQMARTIKVNHETLRYYARRAGVRRPAPDWQAELAKAARRGAVGRAKQSGE